MSGHGIKSMRKATHKHQPWPGNVICRCGLRENHPIHEGTK